MMPKAVPLASSQFHCKSFNGIPLTGIPFNGIPLIVSPLNGIPFPFPFAYRAYGISQAMEPPSVTLLCGADEAPCWHMTGNSKLHSMSYQKFASAANYPVHLTNLGINGSFSLAQYN